MHTAWKKFVVRILLCLVFAVVLFRTINYEPRTIFAQTPSYTAASTSYSPQSPQYINLMFVNVIHSIGCLAEGYSIIGQPCIGFVSDMNKLGMAPVELETNQGGGAIGSIGDVLALTMSTPPIRTSEYIADLGKKLNLVPPAYAQVAGSGNNVIAPIKEIWQLSRNLAYLGMTGIFLIIGFMIMFRHKLNPQTVVNIQSALPGLVVGLVLITFSYFISALVIDTAFLSTNVIGGVFQASGLTTGSRQVIRDGNIFEIFTNFMTGDQALNVANETASALGFLKQGMVGTIITILATIIGCKIGAAIGSAVGGGLGGGLAFLAGPAALLFGSVGNAGGQLAGCLVGGAVFGIGAKTTQIIEWIAGIVLYLVLIIALLVAMFRILFSVISTYIQIVILTLTGPIRIMLGALPGSKGGFGSWLKDLFAQVLIFPALYLVFLIVGFILGGDVGKNLGLDSAKTLTDNHFSGGVVPFLSGLSTSFVRIVLGYGFLLLTPNIHDMIKGAMGVKDPGYSKMVIGAAIGGFGIGRNFFNKAAQIPLKERGQFKEAVMKQKMTTIAGTSGRPTHWWWGPSS